MFTSQMDWVSNLVFKNKQFDLKLGLGRDKIFVPKKGQVDLQGFNDVAIISESEGANLGPGMDALWLLKMLSYAFLSVYSYATCSCMPLYTYILTDNKTHTRKHTHTHADTHSDALQSLHTTKYFTSLISKYSNTVIYCSPKITSLVYLKALVPHISKSISSEPDSCQKTLTSPSV